MTFKLKEKKISLIWQHAWDAAHWARYYPAQQMLPEFTRAPNYQSICEATHPHLCQHQPVLGGGGLHPSQDWVYPVTPELSPGSFPLLTQPSFSAQAGAAAA